MRPDERDLVLYIAEVTRVTGEAPIYAQMQAKMGIKSKGTINRKITRLAAAGYLEHTHRDRQSVRVLRVPPQAEEMRRLVDAAPALLEACELQREVLQKIIRSREIPPLEEMLWPASLALQAIRQARVEEVAP